MYREKHEVSIFFGETREMHHGYGNAPLRVQVGKVWMHKKSCKSTPLSSAFVCRFRRFYAFLAFGHLGHFKALKSWHFCFAMEMQWTFRTQFGCFSQIFFPICFINVVRCGVDGGMVVDFLEMCLSHGMGKEAELKDLIKTIQSY